MDNLSQKYALNICNAIKKHNITDWFLSFEPEKDRGYMFSCHENLDIISREVENDNHSGCSFAISLRNAHAILSEEKRNVININ